MIVVMDVHDDEMDRVMQAVAELLMSGAVVSVSSGVPSEDAELRWMRGRSHGDDVSSRDDIPPAARIGPA